MDEIKARISENVAEIKTDVKEVKSDVKELAAAPTPKQELLTGRLAEESLTKVGQRKINLIWEVTQAIIAVAVTLTTLFVTAYIIVASLLNKLSGWEAAFLLLSNAFFVVISTYLARTNHTKVGGVGEKLGEHRGE